MIFAALLTTASMRANAATINNISTGTAFATTTTCSGRVVTLNKNIVVIATTSSNAVTILPLPEISCLETIQNDYKSGYKARITVHDDLLLNSVRNRVAKWTTINNIKSLQECHYKTTEILKVSSSL